MRGLDTNVILRYLVRDDEQQWQAADRYITEILQANEVCFINNIVLCEVIWVLKSRYKLSRTELIGTIETIANTDIFRFENQEAIAWAVEQMKAGNADFSDYLISRLNQLVGCQETASFDRKLSQLEGVRLL